MQHEHGAQVAQLTHNLYHAEKIIYTFLANDYGFLDPGRDLLRNHVNSWWPTIKQHSTPAAILTHNWHNTEVHHCLKNDVGFRIQEGKFACMNAKFLLMLINITRKPDRSKAMHKFINVAVQSAGSDPAKDLDQEENRNTP